MLLPAFVSFKRLQVNIVCVNSNELLVIQLNVFQDSLECCERFKLLNKTHRFVSAPLFGLIIRLRICQGPNHIEVEAV